MLLAALLLLFVNVSLLVAVLPAVADAAAGARGAGLATAAFFFPAVAAQLPAPLVLHRFPAGRALAVSLVLLGLPCAAYAWRPDSLAVVLGATAVRGVGFGIATVAAGTLVASRAPRERRGAAVGYAGLAAGIPPVFAPAAGVWLLERTGSGPVFLAAGLAALTGALAVPRLARRESAPAPRPRLLRALAAPGVRRPIVWFGLVSVTRGAVVSFVPLTLLGPGLGSAGAFLLLFGTSAFLARWAVGRLADEAGPRRFVVPSVVAALAGLVLLALDGGSAATATAAVLYGAGNGASMTASQLVLLAQARDGRFAVPTAAWNVSLDCGFGIGGLALGLVAAAAGYGTAFWLLPGVLAVALVLALAEPGRGGRASARPAPD